MLRRFWLLRMGLMGILVLLPGGVSEAQFRPGAPDGFVRGTRHVPRTVTPAVNTFSGRGLRWFNPSGTGVGHRHFGAGRIHRFSGLGNGFSHPFHNHLGQGRGFPRMGNRFGLRLGNNRLGNRFPGGFNNGFFNNGLNDPLLANAMVNGSFLNGGQDPTLLNQLALLSGQVELLSGLADFNSAITEGDFRSMVGGAAQGNAMANQVHAAGMYNLMTGLGQSARTEALSNVVRSTGAYNLDTSKAMVHQEEARSAQIDNQQKATQAYYSAKRMHDEYAQARAEREKIPLETHIAVARANVPRPLSPGQFDATTGKIFWPEPLLEPEYAEYRQQLERLFELRAVNPGGSGTTRQIREWTEAMHHELRKHVTEMPGNDYAIARRFLESLAYTVRPSAS